ncbi:hypothetical protein EI94DRAFT_1743691 [Lactarius quietus]|nr:hypothetical protein EI94DRAFT_1743691 [Lactarius quietus]
MNPSQANSRENLRQAIDSEIQSFQESIRTLRRRRNALAPISSLPPEVFASIFSLVRLPDFFILGEEPDQLACLRLSHVCHQWREIALSQPLLWNRVDFTTVTPAGAAEILARARTVPLHLEAIVSINHWENSRFVAFQKELQTHVPHTRHLSMSAEHLHLRKTLEGLVSPAPTLEYLSLSSEEYEDRPTQPRVSIADNIFDGTTPRLQSLVLRNCDISWKSPLLKNLIHLEICTPSVDRRPSLSAWLDMLGELPQLKTLTLGSASPVVPHDASLPSNIDRIVTLPSLKHLELSASARDCGLALAHLSLPALSWLCVMAKSRSWDGADMREILPYVSRHAHGSQDSQPLQSVFVSSETTRTHILAWTEPDIDVELRTPISLFVATRSARVTFIAINEFWSPGVDVGVFDAAMAALPLDSVVTFTAQDRTKLLEKEVWLRHAPRWPLLQHVRLTPTAAHGLRGILLEDNGGRESTLLPSLTNLVLIQGTLGARRTLRLCDVLMKRVEQGVPVETLDLYTCNASVRAVELLREIVVDVVGPAETLDEKAPCVLAWDDEARGLFMRDVDSDVEADDEDNSDADDDDDDAEMAYWGMGHYHNEDYYGEDDEEEGLYDYSML